MMSWRDWETRKMEQRIRRLEWRINKRRPYIISNFANKLCGAQQRQKYPTYSSKEQSKVKDAGPSFVHKCQLVILSGEKDMWQKMPLLPCNFYRRWQLPTTGRSRPAPALVYCINCRSCQAIENSGFK